MFHRSAVSIAVQQEVKMASSPSVSNLGTEVAAHNLYGGATVFDDRIVTFTNP
jgi:hypothetical protein